MAMPRPSGYTLKIAQKVVPGLYRHSKKSPKNETVDFMSEVEIKQTNNIEKR